MGDVRCVGSVSARVAGKAASSTLAPCSCWATMAELVNAVGRVYGTPGAGLVSYAPDERIEALFGRFPPLATPAAEAAGFERDSPTGWRQSSVARRHASQGNPMCTGSQRAAFRGARPAAAARVRDFTTAASRSHDGSGPKRSARKSSMARSSRG